MRIYIAGPISTGDHSLNVRNGILAGDELAQRGHIVFIPHLTHFWHMLCPHANAFWYAQDNEWLPLCDAVLCLPGESVGADGEVELARKLGKPVYFSVDEVPPATRPRPIPYASWKDSNDWHLHAEA